MTPWRLLDTGSLSPVLNMAIDQAILMLHAQGQAPPTLRLYQWQPPAISLGLLQKRHDLDLEACRRLGYEVVRRPTGGRAVLHHHDLTYAVVAGAAEKMLASVSAAYRLIAQGLLNAFHLLGIDAQMDRQGDEAYHTDICFLRGARGSVVHRGRKLVGSAQTWQAGSLLQHGSILLEPQVEAWLPLVQTDGEPVEALRAKLAAHLTSVQEILGWTPPLSDVKQAVRQGMAQALGVDLQPGELTPAEWTLAQELAAAAANQHQVLGGTPPQIALARA